LMSLLDAQHQPHQVTAEPVDSVTIVVTDALHCEQATHAPPTHPFSLLNRLPCTLFLFLFALPSTSFFVPTCVSNITLPCLCWHGWWPMGSLSFGGRTCAYTRKRDTQPWRTSKHIDAHVRTCVLGDASKSMMACTYGSISWPYIACFSPSPILPSSWLTPSRRASYFAKIGEGEKQGGRAPRPPRVRFLQSTR